MMMNDKATSNEIQNNRFKPCCDLAGWRFGRRKRYTRPETGKDSQNGSATLEDLYKLQPTSREFIQKSAGYAVFSDTEPALSKVESGWDGSAQTDAAAKTSKSGGAYSGAASVAPGVWVYQITKTGLALQLSLQGTKYYKGDDLNKP